MKKKDTYFVVLAGGSGTRLWPLSTSKYPKQLLVLAHGKTLLEQTIQLVRGYNKIPAKVLVSTSPNHATLINQAVGKFIDQMVIEPSARNTGPAILYNCLRIYETNPNAIALFLPADSYIPQKDISKFADAVGRAFDFVTANEVIALLGVKPTHAATGYGYIEYHAKVNDASTGLHQIKNFHEKPVAKVAQEYIKCNTMLWNIGMFCGQVSVFLDEFKRHTPDLYQAVFDSVYHDVPFEQVPSISVDYALIEQSKCTWVLPVDFSWCDVGNVSTFLALKRQEEGVLEKLIVYNANNNLVDVPEKLVALVGVNDLCIVQTKDVLLITHSNEAENVREIVKQLKEQEWHEYI